MTDTALPGDRMRPARGIARRLLVTLSMMVLAGLACAPIAYVLWPQAKPVSPDAPGVRAGAHACAHVRRQNS